MVGEQTKEQEGTTKEGEEGVQQKQQHTYKCDCCGKDFVSNRARQGEKLCVDCVELRRALKGFVKRGLTATTVINRAKKLLEVGK